MTAVILAGDGSYTATGERLTGPVDSVDKLERLIEWARTRGLLVPLHASAGQDGDSVPARIWVVGAGCTQLLGERTEESGELTGRLSQSLAALVGRGWELRRGLGSAVVVSRDVGSQRFSVEIVAEPQPWLGGPSHGWADDVGELGRRLRRWYGALATLPADSGAASGAVLLDRLMGARVGRRGAVVTEPGVLPTHVVPAVRIQPPWCATPAELETEFERCEELVWLAQECPQLASAGTLTFGHGAPRHLEGAAAQEAARAAKKPFGLWRVMLPPASGLQIPAMLPAPHPHMASAHSVQAWVSTEDLAGLAGAIRDGGAGLTVEDLGIDQAILWPAQSRLLEAWAARLRQARDEFADDPPMRALIESAATDYLEALADPHPWSDPTSRHHFQPAWAATIAARVRFRGRRAAMRISREYRVWPVYAREAAMIYLLGRDEATGAPIELSDTHSRLGRLAVTARTEVTDDTILAVLQAQNFGEVAEALTSALDMPADHDATADQPDTQAGAVSADPDQPGPRGADHKKVDPQDISGSDAAIDTDREPAPKAGPARKAARPAATVTGGTPAAVLHTDGLWLADGTHIEPESPILHVGQVAELAYTHRIGYQLTPKFAEPGQIWITEAACLEFGIDVEAINRRDRAKSLRQLTTGLDFVTLAVADGWSLGGAGEDPTAQRLGTWTRVYRDDKRGVMIALIPGMGAGPDEMPILAEEPSPVQIAHRLKLLADALHFPWKINAGVTAVDLMMQTRTKTWSPKEWKNVVFAPSTAEVPFGIGDVESDFDWSRQPTAQENQLRYVHAYDRGGSYVAGIAGLELPIGEPIHHPDGAPFNASTPGYWLAEIPEAADWQLPYVLNPRGLHFTQAKWVCTPTLERAIALGYQPTILQAWLWPQHGRVLIGWYERFRDASTTLDIDDADAQAARNQAKIIRTHGIGIIGSAEHLKGKPGYSPERRLHVVAKAKANIVYRLHQIGTQTGQWPLAVATDTVLYASDDPDPRTAWPGDPQTLGRGFGQYKPEGSALLADHIEHLNGRDYRGRPDLTPTAQWCAQLAQAADSGSR